MFKPLVSTPQILLRSISRPRIVRTVLHSAALRPVTLQLRPHSVNSNCTLLQSNRRLQQRLSGNSTAYKMCRYTNDASGSVSNVPQGRVILPDDVIPKHYDVQLEVDFKKFTFDGIVVIDLECVKDTTSISLNTVDIEIHSTEVHADGELVTNSPKLSYDKDIQTTKIELGQTIKKGQKVTLKQVYTGELNDKMVGFYRAKSQDGNQQWMAVTQFEATDARRALPCFDEPALKAEFTVTLIADEGMTCLSNMDVGSTSTVDSNITGGKRNSVKFNRSPRMSTYLLAFIIGQLKSVSTDKFRLPVKVWMTPDQNEEDGRYSAELGARTLAFYEKAFASEYPLPKMDMVAVPDFSAGAMENWGLVTYRIADLLLDEKTAGAASKERVAEVVQHELAHQWFGNLVTMDFWDGLWLNEGFATWMSWYSCNEFYPEWKVWETFVIDNLQAALGLDSLRSSHPIEVPVHRAEDINQIFDSISYSKGSAVLRMISKYLGEDVFLEGVRKYIKKHAWGNTQTGDLWDSLSEASGKDVRGVMDIWTKQIGYPVVTVTEDEAKGTIALKQNRFLRTGDVKEDEDTTLYPVILGLKTEKGIDESAILTKRQDSVKIPGGLDFFKLNADHSSLFRTSYSPERLSKLGKAAKEGKLTVEDRAGMIADAGALASSGYGKTSGVLNLLKSFDTEDSFIVWNQILTRISAIRSAWTFQPQPIKDALKKFQLDLCRAKAHELGWDFAENEDHVMAQYKSLMFGSAGLAGDEKIISAAKSMFAKYANGDHDAVHPNIRSSVFAMVIRDGGEKEWTVLVDRYRTAPTAEEKNTCLRALGRAQSEDLIQKTLDFALSGKVKMQDIYMPIGGLSNHKLGIEDRWVWMQKNWDNLIEKLPPSMTMLSSVVSMCIARFCDQSRLDEIQEFFKGKDIKGYERALNQSLDGIRANISWLERDNDDVESWLVSSGYLKGGQSDKSSQKL